MLTLDKIYHAAFVLKDVARKTFRRQPANAAVIRQAANRMQTNFSYKIHSFSQ